MKTELQERADGLASNLQRSINACFEVLQSISQLFASSAFVERQEFQRFVQPVLSRHPSIQALEWLPRLLDGDRPCFEQQVQTEGFADFQVTEQARDGTIQRAQPRPEYFPVYYAEPLAGNQLALGFDLASDPIRRAALEKARDSGEMVLSRRIELVQEAQKQHGFLVILPVYRHGSPCITTVTRRHQLQGFVLGVFRVSDVIQSALSGLNLDHIDFYLCDQSESLTEGLIAAYDSQTRRIIIDLADQGSVLPWTSDILKTREREICTRHFPVADRQWMLLLIPTAAYVDRAELYQQSRIRAAAATAEAEKLKLALRNLQQTQARWFLEKRLIAFGVGLIFVTLTTANLLSYQTITQLISRFEQMESLVIQLIPTPQSGPSTGSASGHPSPQQVVLDREGSLLSSWKTQARASLSDTLLITLTGIVLSAAFLLSVYYLLQRQMNERQQVESALLEANNQLEFEVQQRVAELEETREISDLKMRLFSMVSHEFRTPLSTILVSTQLLAGGDRPGLDERTSKNLTRIQSAARTMAQLLDDILTLNRAEAGKLEFRPESLDLYGFCQQIIDQVQLTTAQSIHFICPDGATEAVVDSKLWHSILSNLLSNAIKYSSPHSSIYLILKRTSSSVMLQVEDEGIGIPPEDQQRLYEIFHRGRNVGDILGTGLGLAVVKTCVDLHGGQVTVESQVGQGTTFTVMLPQ